MQKYYVCTIDFEGPKIRARVADSTLKRIIGLMFEQKINSPMIFRFGSAAYHGIWMKNMNFSIDVVWAKGNKIVDIAENLPPCKSYNCKTYAPKEPADIIIELDAGAVKRMHLKKSKTFKIN